MLNEILFFGLDHFIVETLINRYLILFIMELIQYTSKGPISIENDKAFDFFIGLWEYIMPNDTHEVMMGTHGKLVSRFNYFQSQESNPEHQRIATTFIATYVLAEKESLDKIADAFEKVAEDLKSGRRDVQPYLNLANILRQNNDSIVFANQNADPSKFYKDGKLLHLDGIASQIPSATKLPVLFGCQKGHSDFY
jgi:hypothetical protein